MGLASYRTTVIRNQVNRPCCSHATHTNKLEDWECSVHSTFQLGHTLTPQGFVIMQKELFQNTQLTSHFDEALHSMIYILWAVNCTNLYPHTSLVLWNHGVTETDHVYALSQELCCHVRSQPSVPKHHRLHNNVPAFRILCPGTKPSTWALQGPCSFFFTAETVQQSKTPENNTG